MIGRKARCFAPVPAVSLDELVPANHFYRHVERMLDLSFARDGDSASVPVYGRGR